MKKIYIGLVAILCVSLAVAAAGTGYKLLTATSHFIHVEGVEAQYYETLDSQWHDLPLTSGQVDFGIANIKPGETTQFCVRGRDTAANGKLNLQIQIDESDYLRHSLVCNQSGVQYSIYENVYHVLLEGGSDWQTICISTTASGDLPITVSTFNNTVYRTDALSTYNNTCE